MTYKNDYINFEITQKERTDSKKPKTKILVDGKKWQKKTKIDKSLGDISIKTTNGKTIEITVEKLGFTMTVTRGSIFFKITIKVDNDNTPHVGLCQTVPKKDKDILLSEYKMYSQTVPLIGHSGTYVSLVKTIC